MAQNTKSIQGKSGWVLWGWNMQKLHQFFLLLLPTTFYCLQPIFCKRRQERAARARTFPPWGSLLLFSRWSATCCCKNLWRSSDWKVAKYFFARNAQPQNFLLWFLPGENRNTNTNTNMKTCQILFARNPHPCKPELPSRAFCFEQINFSLELDEFLSNVQMHQSQGFHCCLCWTHNSLDVHYTFLWKWKNIFLWLCCMYFYRCTIFIVFCYHRYHCCVCLP